MKAFILISILFFSFTALQAQTVIKGTILDDETGEPLPGVNVFIAGSSIGTATNDTGYYTFKTSIRGRFDLVVSFLGYLSINRKITLSEEDSSLTMDFRMKTNELQLNEIEVVDKRDTKWEDRFAAFRRFFMGTDEFADQTQILNPEVIDFQSLTGAELLVTFRQPLRLKNYATGYEIELSLQLARFDPVKSTGFWKVFARYSEIENDNSSLTEIWEENREKAFTGSSRHFFKSLLENRVRTNGFVVLPRTSAIQKTEETAKIQRLFPRDWENITNNYHAFEIVNVNFAVAHEPELDRNGNVENFDELSSFDIRNQYGMVVVDDFGNVFNSEQVIFLGPWSSDRFAKSLPLNYEVE